MMQAYWDQHGLPRHGLCRLPNQLRNPQRYPRTDLRPPPHEICKEMMSPGMWKGNDPTYNASQYLHGMFDWVDWSAVLCNSHRIYEETLLDITGYRRVIVARAPLERRVIKFYTAYCPSSIWKALTHTMPL